MQARQSTARFTTFARHTSKLINEGTAVCRMALIIAIVSLIISCFLILGFNDVVFHLGNEVISAFIWFSVIGGIWICLLSTVFLLISIAIYNLDRKVDLASVQTGIILTLVNIASLAMAYLCALTIN